MILLTGLGLVFAPEVVPNLAFSQGRGSVMVLVSGRRSELSEEGATDMDTHYLRGRHLAEV